MNVTLLLALMAFGSFAWARRYFFLSSTETSKHRLGLRAVGPLLGVLVLSLMAIDDTERMGALSWAAAGFQLVALSAFWATAFEHRRRRPSIAGTKGAPQELITSGTYRLVRHPFYMSYMLFWIGCAISTVHPLSMLAAAVMFLLYVRTAWAEESEILQSSNGAAYSRYAQGRGMIFPLWWPRD